MDKLREIIAIALYERLDPDSVGWENITTHYRGRFFHQADQIIAALEESKLVSVAVLTHRNDGE